MDVSLWPTLPKPNIKGAVSLPWQSSDWEGGQCGRLCYWLFEALPPIRPSFSDTPATCSGDQKHKRSISYGTDSFPLPYCLLPFESKMLLGTIWIKGGVCKICLEKTIYLNFTPSLFNVFWKVYCSQYLWPIKAILVWSFLIGQGSGATSF